MNIIAWIKSLLSPTVDSIVADIAAKAAKLSIVAEAKKLEAEGHEAIVVERQKLALTARIEVARATAVAAKFEALIS